MSTVTSSEQIDHLDMATRYCALLNELPIAREYNDSLIAFMHHLEAQG